MIASDGEVILALFRVAEAAAAYRAAEQDGTPRLWKGKDLCDLAARLDDELVNLSGALPDGMAVRKPAAGGSDSNADDCGFKI